MKKIMNKPEQMVDQMLDGIAFTHMEMVERLAGTMVMHRTTPKSGKVGLVSGGGSGHEPAHIGFLGKGMLSAVVAGQIFSAPTPDQILKGIQAADEGRGVLLIVKNYTGDILNFKLAKELAELDGIAVETVIVDDDIAVQDSTYTAGRRGIAGTVLVHKILGAAAEAGKSLAEIKALAEQVVPQVKTIGVGLKGATNPEVGQAGFELADDEIEYGIGIHGEPGYRRQKIQPSKLLAQELIDKLRASFNWSKGEQYAVLINGMGGTPLMEQFIFMNDVRTLLMEQEGLSIPFRKVGNYMTSLDMEGVSLTMLKLENPLWLDYLQAKVEVISW